MRFEFENRKILTHILLRRNFGCSFMDINNALSAIILEFYLVYAWTKALRDKFHFDTQNSPVSLVHTHWYNTRSKAINVSKTSCCVARPSISGSKFDNCFNIVTEDRQHTINRCHVKSRSSLFWTFVGIFFSIRIRQPVYKLFLMSFLFGSILFFLFSSVFTFPAFWHFFIVFFGSFYWIFLLDL